MRIITWQSAPAILLDDWLRPAGGFSLTAELPSNVEVGQTVREARSTLASNLQFAARYEIYNLDPASITEFRNTLQQYSVQPVLAPLWVAKRRPGSSHPVTAAWYAYQIGLHGIPTVITAAAAAALPASPTDWLVPLMVGHLSSWPDPQVLTNDLTSIELQFQEDSPLFLTLASFATTPGPIVNGVAPTLFPFRHNTHANPVSQAARVKLQRMKIGQGREYQSVFYSQPSQRVERRSYILRDLEVWGLLRYFQDLGGSQAALWLPSAVQETDLSADIAASATALPVVNPAARGQNTFFIVDDLENRSACKVTSTAGSTWNISAPIGQAYEATYAMIFSLILARFNLQRLEIRFDDDPVAKVDIPFLELPWETVSPPDETYGVTTGALGGKACLYKFQTTLQGTTQTWTFTSFGAALTYSGATYEPKPFDHGDITDTLGLDFQSVKLETFAFPGNPVMKFVPFTLEAPLLLEIFECKVSGGAATDVLRVFQGEVTGDGAQFVGPQISVTAKSFSTLLDRSFPRLLVQLSDNFQLFDTGNGLLRTNWEWAGTVTSWVKPTYTLTIGGLNKAAIAVSDRPAHYFANGSVLIGSGASAQLRRISDSNAQTSQTLVTKLSGDIEPPAVGAAVLVYPGYDLQHSTAKDKFNNRANFGGFPYMPIGNPSLTKISETISPGGKK